MAGPTCWRPGNWPGYAYIGHRRYKDGTAGRLFYFYSPLVEASKAAAASAVATAARTPGAPGTGGDASSARTDKARLAAKPGPRTTGRNPRPRPRRLTVTRPGRPGAGDPAGARRPGRFKKGRPGPGGRGRHDPRHRQGDMLSALAKRYGVPRDAILAANPGIAPTNLKLGQTLRIPAGKGPQAPTPSGTEAQRTETPRTETGVAARPVPEAKPRSRRLPGAARAHREGGAGRHAIPRGRGGDRG
jgi:phage tail protein X